MSTRDVITACEGRELFCLPPSLEGEETPRAIFVSREVHDIVMPPWPDSRDGRMFASLRALLDGFTQGDFVTVAEDPFKKEATAILARVHPVEEELFDFRCLDPSPGIRAFGFFAEIDTFVVLSWNFRDNLDGNWDSEVNHCTNEWKRIFGSVPPHKGTKINEYISFNFRSV